MPPTTTPSFYKRELPSQCIDFASPEGRKLFTAALTEGYLEGYFKISQHLTTQADPAFCGLASLTIALNALDVDPLRQWQGRQSVPWRFWSQDMLDCCRTLDDVRKAGITLEEYHCLASCNGLTAKLSGGAHGFPQDREAGVHQFREAVKTACSRPDQVLTATFSRKVLGQTGTGHFANVGGYCAASDQVLLLETALFKYPVFWIPLETLFDAMLPVDPATNHPRGYVVMSKLVMSALKKPSASLLSLNVSGFVSRMIVSEEGENSCLVCSPGQFHKNSWANLISIVAQELKDVDAPSLSQLIQAIQRSTPTPLLERILNSKEVEYQEHLDGLFASAKSLAPDEDPRAIIFALALDASRPKALMARGGMSVLQPSATDQIQDAQLKAEVQELARLMANLDQCCQREGKTCSGCTCAPQ